MTNYLQHLGVTAWRKKSALLVASGLLFLIIFGLQYVKVATNEKTYLKTKNRNNDIPIVESNPPTELLKQAARFRDLSKLEQPSRDEIARKRSAGEVMEDQQLGIPHVAYNRDHPYVPSKRIVHLDLKGAPPVVTFIKKFFHLVANMGATGILIEYEDMFPYDGILKDIRAKNSYSIKDVHEIIKVAASFNLEVIPLIQTFGHLEFALKRLEWAKLREVEGSPQALCPSRNSSLDFIQEMVRQVMALHPNVKYLHIGCDEVFQMGECPICRLELHETLFLRHVQKVAQKIHQIHPHLRLIIWDDMLRHLSQQSMLEVNLGSLVEPMVWVYAEDIYRFVQSGVWEKYGAVFKTAWAASAYKGAFGETLSVPDTKRHLENNLRWLEVMMQQQKVFSHGFRGLVLTGWQRYDHFAVLCELLPAGIPSLGLSLIAVNHGYFNVSLKHKFQSLFSCPQENYSGDNIAPFINLDIDPFMWDKMGRCMFPGSAFFKITYRLHALQLEFEDFAKSIKKQKGWMTDYNIRRNYSLPLRVDELIADLPRIYHGATSLIRSAVDSMTDIFDNFTINEWIEQNIYPIISELEKIQNQSIALKSVNHWPARPLPVLRDLQRLGVPVP